MNRDRFPGLRNGYIRLDGPAGSQVLDTCATAVHDYLCGPNVANLHAPSAASRATDDLLAECRTVVARLLGGYSDGLIFGPSTTVLTARFASALSRQLSPGDEIVCTQLDHDANISPWLDVAGRTDATVRMANVNPKTLELPVAAITDLLTPRTRVVAMTAASNVTGTQPDLAAIAQAVHSRGALLFVDAVHAIPHGPAEVAACHADAVVCSAYKWFGPHVSALSVRPSLLDTLSPTKVRPAPAHGPEKWERGALPFELLPGLAAAAQYVQSVNWVAAQQHEAQLLAELLAGLQKLPGVKLLGSPSRRTSTVAFTVDGLSPAHVAGALADQNIAVGCGNFYAVELFAQLGIDSCLRVGALHYNDHDDVERLLDAVRHLTRGEP